MEICKDDIINIEQIELNIVYDIEVQDNHNYFIDCGKEILVHNSSKTWSIIQFIILYCQINGNKGKRITCARAKFSWVKPSILADFVEILLKYGFYDVNNHNRTDQIYTLFGNQISFIGLDDKQKLHGRKQDIFWINEAMESEFADFQQLNQRTSELFILDYNPSFTEHWIFNSVIPRPDTKFFRSTQLDNPFLDERIRTEILSYQPTAENITNGTADDYMWKVYGLGERAAAQGIIFKHVTWVDSFPKDIDYSYGLDFGFTNDPTALVKLGIKGNDLFVELLLYEPIDNSVTLNEYLQRINIEQYKNITADSSDRYNDNEMVRELREQGYNINKVNKGKGINWRIGLLKKHKINIVHNINAKREQENYKWREINGILINEPIDKFNHFWDALGYGYLGINKPKMEWL